MKHSKSSLFLMELIVSILFFSLASAICIQLFARSHSISAETINLNNAITQAQNLAECWYASEGDLHAMQDALPCSRLSAPGDALTLCFDQDWQLLSADTGGEENGYYASLTSFTDAADAHLLSAKISVCVGSSGKVVYTLSLSQHVAETRGAYE